MGLITAMVATVVSAAKVIGAVTTVIGGAIGGAATTGLVAIGVPGGVAGAIGTGISVGITTGLNYGVTGALVGGATSAFTGGDIGEGMKSGFKAGALTGFGAGVGGLVGGTAFTASTSPMGAAIGGGIGAAGVTKLAGYSTQNALLAGIAGGAGQYASASAGTGAFTPEGATPMNAWDAMKAMHGAAPKALQLGLMAGTSSIGGGAPAPQYSPGFSYQPGAAPEQEQEAAPAGEAFTADAPRRPAITDMAFGGEGISKGFDPSDITGYQAPPPVSPDALAKARKSYYNTRSLTLQRGYAP